MSPAALYDHQRAILDRVFGAGTAERWAADRIAEQLLADHADAIATGRRREGNPSTWYASITWSRQAWANLYGNRPPKARR